MKKAFVILASFIFSLSAMAFDFAGKTFKAELRAGGTTLSQTVKFSSNSKVKISSGRSQRGVNLSDDKTGTWSVEGGNVVVTFDDGETTQYRILDLGGKVSLIHSSWGEFKQVGSSGSAKKGTRSKKSRKK